MSHPSEISATVFHGMNEGRNFLREFALYYETQYAEDPESWPMNLTPEEWWEQFSTYIYKIGVGEIKAHRADVG
jgi:hypothetical protein